MLPTGSMVRARPVATTSRRFPRAHLERKSVCCSTTRSPAWPSRSGPPSISTEPREHRSRWRVSATISTLTRRSEVATPQGTARGARERGSQPWVVERERLHRQLSAGVQNHADAHRGGGASGKSVLLTAWVGSRVLFAGLYWGGKPSRGTGGSAAPGAPESVGLRPPGAPAFARTSRAGPSQAWPPAGADASLQHDAPLVTRCRTLRLERHLVVAVVIGEVLAEGQRSTDVLQEPVPDQRCGAAVLRVDVAQMVSQVGIDGCFIDLQWLHATSLPSLWVTPTAPA